MRGHIGTCSATILWLEKAGSSEGRNDFKQELSKFRKSNSYIVWILVNYNRKQIGSSNRVFARQPINGGIDGDYKVAE